MYCIEDLNDLQISIMMVVKEWAHLNPDNPITKKHILVRMREQQMNDSRVIHALEQLQKKLYLRQGYSYTNKTIYVMMRSI